MTKRFGTPVQTLGRWGHLSREKRWHWFRSKGHVAACGFKLTIPDVELLHFHSQPKMTVRCATCRDHVRVLQERSRQPGVDLRRRLREAVGRIESGKRTTIIDKYLAACVELTK